MISGFLGALLAVAATDSVPADPCASRKAAAAPQAFVSASRPVARDTLVVAAVCVLPATGVRKVGSYHGELHFDSTQARVLRVEKPAGGVRVENTGLPGMVKFAGAEPNGFAPGRLISVVFRVRRPGASPALRLKMIELNATDGTSLMKQLMAGSGTP